MPVATPVSLDAESAPDGARSRRRSCVTKWSSCSSCPDLAPAFRQSEGAGRDGTAGRAEGGAAVRVPARFLGASLILHALVLASVPPFAAAPASPTPRLHARLVLPTPLAPPLASVPAGAPAKPARASASSRPEPGAKAERRKQVAAPAVVANQAAAIAPPPSAAENTGSVPAVASPAPAPASAVPPAIPSPAPVASKRASEGPALDAYARTLSAEIARQRRYPAVARMRGWQGTAVLAITLSPAGAVLKSSLSRSSGHAVLDEQALKMVAEASPLPIAPPPLHGRTLEFELPVVFALAAS